MQLVAEKLSARRGGRILFAGLSFVVEAGEALLVTGPNGAGKTTLLRTLAGFLQPEAGQVRLEGGDADAGIGEQCHYVGHANAVKPGLTVAENAAFWCGFLGDGLGGRRRHVQGGEDGQTPRRRVRGEADTAEATGLPPAAPDQSLDTALATFGLEALRDIPAGYLSAGQRRRAGLMRLLLARRPVWLLDEPTASLDQAGQEALARVVNAHLAAGGQVVAATHMALGFDRARELRLARPAAAA